MTNKNNIPLLDILNVYTMAFFLPQIVMLSFVPSEYVLAGLMIYCLYPIVVIWGTFRDFGIWVEIDRVAARWAAIFCIAPNLILAAALN